MSMRKFHGSFYGVQYVKEVKEEEVVEESEELSESESSSDDEQQQHRTREVYQYDAKGPITDRDKLTATILTHLTSYVPERVLYAFVQGLVHRDLAEPYMECFDMALLFVDMSGFTPLTERLSAEGAQGIEKLSFHLNGFFGKMIDVVRAHGGDVLKFAGDALMISWADKDVTGACSGSVCNP